LLSRLAGRESRLVKLKAYAKINLWLRVLGRRADGYHELDSLMAPLALWDDIQLEAAPGQDIVCSCPGHPELDGERNLAWRAARAWQAESGLTPGLRITIRKRIPLASGMGGGSSDAASVLMGLQQTFGSPPDPARLQALAVGLGADVPFFLRGGVCLARGIGELLAPVAISPFWVILATAPFGLSTRTVFEGLRIPLTSSLDGVSQKSPLERFARLAGSLRNDLLETAVSLREAIGRVRDELLLAGAAGASMSGSGPTVFGLFRTRSEAREGLQRLVREAGWTYTVLRGIHTPAR
jgi:4-diphosphocytidyl-2-C-methyl-D-erythritol kinase